MRKQLFLFALTALLVLSCTTSSGTVFDDSVPIEETAWISPGPIGIITGYNGIPVKWKADGTKLIQIPAGETTLEWDVNTTDGYTNYKGKNMVMSYNFRPQKQYVFSLTIIDEKYGLNVQVYDFGEKVSGTKSDLEKHFEAFTPFLNAAGVGAKTVLE